MKGAPLSAEGVIPLYGHNVIWEQNVTSGSDEEGTVQTTFIVHKYGLVLLQYTIVSDVRYATLCFEHVSTRAEERIISANHLVNHRPTAEVFSLFEFLGEIKSVRIALWKQSSTYATLLE